jgi:lambda repressor-like predicted transcriptional regulator
MFKHTDIGPKVDKDPGKAADQLSAEIAARGSNLVRTAKELGVHYRTLTRWLDKLLDAGHDVRAKALELQVDAASEARAKGEKPVALPPRVGRPFKPRSVPRPRASA